MESVIYSNVESYEGTATTSVSQTLELYSRKLIVTNDSGSVNLSFYPKGSAAGTKITLKPTETITLDRFRTKEITVSSTNSPYRIWVFG